MTLSECVLGALRDGWNFACQRTLFVAASTVAIFSIRVVALNLNTAPEPHTFAAKLTLFALWTVGLLLANMLVVQGLRHVLLNRQIDLRHNIAGLYYWRTCAFAFAFYIGIMAAMIFCVLFLGILILLLRGHDFGLIHLLHEHEIGLAATGVWAFLIFSGWLFTRLSLLACHLAIGGKMKWRAAWRDTRGHALSIVSTYLLLYSYLVMLAGVFGIIGTVFAIILHDGFHGPVMELVKMATLVAGLIVFGSGSGWIYRRFASSLIHQST